jgi:hypothetical protein
VKRLWLCVVALALAGCSGDRPGKQEAPDAGAKAGAEESEIDAALAKLGGEDRKLAEAQKFCAVMTDHRLGSMGTPVKLVLKGQPVFLCCKGCTRKAQADPDGTLERVKNLKAKATGNPTKE